MAVVVVVVVVVAATGGGGEYVGSDHVKMNYKKCSKI